MDVLNMNIFAVHPRLVKDDGSTDSITVMPKRRVTIPDGFSVDLNWIAGTEKVSVFESKTSRTAINTATRAGTGVVSVAVAGSKLAKPGSASVNT